MIRWIVEPVRHQPKNSYDVRHGTKGTLWVLFIPIFSWTRWRTP